MKFGRFAAYLMGIGSVGLAFLICTYTVRGQEQSLRPGFERVATAITNAIRWEMDDKQLPSVAIALVDADGVIWADAFGFADAAKTRPASVQTLYRVGSVSKLFTDIAVMQLVEEGLIDLDTSIAHYLPEFSPHNPYETAITARMLMSHRSGLVREPPVGHYFDPREPNLLDTVMSLNRTALVYPPGEKTKYSNAAVSVVGLLVERLDGQRHAAAPFADIVRRRILEPLGMETSRFVLDAATRPLAVESVMWGYDGRQFPAPTFDLGTLPAGNLYSSVREQAYFIEALLAGGVRRGHRILQLASLAEMFRRQYDGGHAPEREFGLGFVLSELDSHRRVGHGGAVYGCATELALLPDENLGVIVVASKDCANHVVQRLASFALRTVLAERNGQPPIEWQRTMAVGTRAARELAGEYRRAEKTPGPEYATLLARGEELVLEWGVFRGNVRRRSDRLVVDDVLWGDKAIDIVSPSAIRIDGAEYRRLADQPPPPIPERLQGLVGEYGWDHNILFLYERHGRLHALIEWFFDYPLTEIDSNTFAFPDYGLYHGERLVFDRDAAGVARGVTAAEVHFERRAVSGDRGPIFRIEPVRPIAELRVEALQATPPTEVRDFLPPDLVAPTALDDSIRLDIRYASERNFLGVPVYEEALAFLQRPAAEALVRAHRRLAERGYGLLIHDAYRPWYVTKIFYDATPGAMKHFVANPQLGSRHNRGCAVDVTLFDRVTGHALEMVSGYDEFTERAYPDYPGSSHRARWHRELLRSALEAEGFQVYEYEWWHFDFQDWQRYPILNEPFARIAVGKSD